MPASKLEKINLLILIKWKNLKKNHVNWDLRASWTRTIRTKTISKNTNPEIIKKRKEKIQTQTTTTTTKQPFKTEFSCKSLIHMIFTDQTHKPSKQTNLQQTHKPIFS